MINLQVIIDGLEMVDDMNTVFLDLETGDTVYLSDFDPSLTEDTAELLEEYPDRFLRLPDQREINEYGMMEDFIDSLPDSAQKHTLEMAINGRGAFRRFKDTVNRYGIEDQWSAFSDAAYASLARHWCEENDVEFYQACKAPSDPADMEKLLTDFFSDEDEVDVVKLDSASMADPNAVKEFLSTLFTGKANVDVVVDGADRDEDGDDSEEDESSSGFAPEQAAKLYELYEQLQCIQGQLEELAGAIEGNEASDTLYEASSSVEDAVDSLEEIIDGGVDVDIFVDGKTSTAGIIKLTELLKKMADRENEDE